MKTFLERHTPSLGGWFVITVLAALLALAIGYVVNFLGSFPADSGSDSGGGIAFTFGALMTLAVGVGLMVLIFYSSRRGYDEPPRVGSAEQDDKTGRHA